MALPAFDTHAYVKKLKVLGIPEQQAEGIVDFQNQVLSEIVTEKLATKEDIKHLEGDIKHLEEDIKHLEHKLKNEIKNLSIEFKGKFNLLYWIGTFLLAGIVSILIKLFH